MSRHRAPVRPRYGRIAALGVSLSVTVVAITGAAMGFPSESSETYDGGSSDIGAAASIAPAASESDPAPADASTSSSGAASTSPLATESDDDPALDPALPVGSGTGKRVVFSQSRQRVWLVGPDGSTRRTYLVSGSVYDNLDPGTYSVYSRSQQAWGIDDSGTMRYFVRFAHGDNAAIGFHDIPVDDGKPLQTVAQLGTPQSHGCIRQKREDAIALSDFAPIGTSVVVTA